MTERGKRRLRYFGLAMSLALLSLIVSNADQLSEASAPEFENRGAAPATETLTPIVERYAPFIYRFSGPLGSDRASLRSLSIFHSSEARLEHCSLTRPDDTPSG